MLMVRSFTLDSMVQVRGGFRECGALDHLSFWPIWPFVWKAWKYAPLMCSDLSKIYLL